VCDLETSRMGAPYIYDISRLRVNEKQYRQDSNNDMKTLLTDMHMVWCCTPVTPLPLLLIVMQLVLILHAYC